MMLAELRMSSKYVDAVLGPCLGKVDHPLSLGLSKLGLSEIAHAVGLVHPPISRGGASVYFTEHFGDRGE